MVAAFDNNVADLSNFLGWMAEPMQQQRKQMGVWILLFLGLFLLVAWRLNAAYWKNVKYSRHRRWRQQALGVSYRSRNRRSSIRRFPFSEPHSGARSCSYFYDWNPRHDGALFWNDLPVLPTLPLCVV